MKKTFLSCLFALVATMAFSQLNMTLLDQIDYGPNANDIWGWVDPDDGTEYALVGLVNGFSIVDLTDPTDIQEVIRIDGPSSTWRDIKTWGDHIYVTNETSNGVLVVDMTDAPNNITWFDWTPDIPGLGTLSRCHNLYIDEFGYCYLSGCNLNSGGMLIVDVFSDPGNPQYVSAAPPVYSHDVYVRDNKMFASEIYVGNMTIYDVSDKQNIVQLGTQNTPFNFTHNVWLNDAGDVAFTTDEKANAPVAAYDISDYSDIVELDQFLPIETLGEGVIPHNVHVWEDWLIISYYTDGGIIADASRPDNIIEVGNWDTFLGSSGGFSGVWGAYPFLPSGLVLLTDIGTGLYVCGADYVRACWLEGKVTNMATGAPIFGASVSINSQQANFATTDFIGEYKTGQALPGSFDVTFTASGFYPKTVSADLENGILTILNVELEPLTSFSVSGQTIRQEDGSPAAGASVFFDGDQDFEIFSDANGNFTIDDVIIGDYTIYAGGWGFLLEVIDNYTVDGTNGPLTIELTRGYQDDFATDLGWTTSGTAERGQWERGEPIGTFTGGGAIVNPEFDIDSDFGDQCYVTDNRGGDVSDFDVDNGTVILTSPPMDLTTYGDPVVSYNTWFWQGGPFGTPNDALEVRVSNGIEEVVLEIITNSASSWNPTASFRLLDYIDLTDNVQVIFETSDLPGSGNWVEAAVDAFLVVDEAAYPPFAATQTNGCLPHTVQFSDMSDSTATWTWTFDGGNPATSNEQNPTVEYTQTGVYNVTLEVETNSGITYVIERPNYISVGMAPTADFAADITGEVATFTNNSMGGGTYTWDFGDGTTSNEEDPSHSYNAVGTYTVALTVTNECGTNTYSQDVLVLAIPPVVGIGVSSTDGCTPFVVEFTDESTGAPDTWNWTFLGGDPAISNEQNPTVTYNTPGTWSVMLTVSNAAGESTVQETQLITVSPSPEAAYNYTVNGPEVTFVNTSANGDSYVWDFGDGTTSTEFNPFHTFPGVGEYEVTLTVESDCGFVAFTQNIVIDEATATKFLDETAFQLSVAPNPFRSQFNLNYDLKGAFGQAQVAIFNVLGEQLTTRAINTASGSLSLGEELTHSGVYFIRLVVDGKAGKAVRIVKM
ncbi:MAG: choice-of-anchor B family protein [Bacteroidota bacterium]